MDEDEALTDKKREREGEGGECETKTRKERGGNADGHVSMGAQERSGVRESCIIVAGQ